MKKGMDMLREALSPKKYKKNDHDADDVKGKKHKKVHKMVDDELNADNATETLAYKKRKSMCKTHKKVHCKMCKTHKKAIKTSGTFKGKSNKLGFGGRAAQLKAQGVPGGVIGNLARAAGAAKGMKNYHGK